MQCDKVLPSLAGKTVTLSGTSGVDYPADNFMPWIGVLIRKPTTTSAAINRACYQCNCSFDWVNNKFELRLRNAPYGVGVLWGLVTWTPPGGSAGKYINLPVFNTVDDEMLENGCSIKTGQVVSKMKGTSLFSEVPACHTKLNYGGWEDPNYPIAQAQKKNLLVSNDRLVEYTFDYINDPDSYDLAVAFFKSIGHPSAVTQVDRRMSMEMSTKGMRWQSGDPIVWQNFPMITTPDETDGFFDGTGTFAGILYALESDGATPPNYYTDRLMGALGVVLSVTVEIDTTSIKVTVESRQSNLWLNDIDILSNGGLPPGANNPSPPVAPTEGSPNNGGAGNIGPFSGGGGNPMPFTLSHPSGITINTSLSDGTESITLTPLGDSVNNEGWAYIIELVTKEVNSFPGHGLAVSPTVGAVANYPSNVPITHTITAGYNTFRDFGFANQVKETQITFQVTRTIPIMPGSPVSYQDYTKFYVDIERPDPIGIIAS
jgi:hypothetical protein